MKTIDRLLQGWRIAKARPFIKPGMRILDVGSADGALFRHLKAATPHNMGIDPTLEANATVDGVPLIAGKFPDNMPAVDPFDAITLLAVLEHFPPSEYEKLERGCAHFLKPGGVLIVTVPSPKVDTILAMLKFLRLIDGMSLEEHHGFEVDQTTTIFSPKYFRLLKRKPFQLGLNYLYVFERFE